MYHIKGELNFLGISDNDFKIYFSSTNEENAEKCNKKNNSNNKQYNCDLCYGSVFKCLKKDKNKIIFIPKNKIMFVIKRVYFYRPSGLEIFTSDNKSYNFNFWEKYDQKEENIIIKAFMADIDFSEIKQMRTLGWYNKNFVNILFPLFNNNINEWKTKNYYYSNFDKLMIINLFSNRSFNDLHQYPVFPMLYDEIKLKRQMNEPIGFQEITKESRDRKQLILDSYNYGEDDDDNENSLFNLVYSNITYTCNYLIRVFPYSFIGIEYQGGGFDDPNRLFYSINSTMNNTLNQRADLRELIPEMFYFPPLFNNINEVELKKIANGRDIDKVIINDWNEDEKEKYKFLVRMRNSLEKEEKLNEWIDLIFGINKNFRKNKEGKKEIFYSNNMNVGFGDNQDILNNDIIMQRYDFGVLPTQLFYEKFPEKDKKAKCIKEKIKEFNEKQFNEDHIKCLISGKESFICKGEKGINKEYLKILNEEIFNHFSNGFSDFQGTENIYYLFIGDVFGNLYIYLKEEEKIFGTRKDKDIYEVGEDKNLLDKILNKEYTLFKILNDHTNEIKYIDYNPRLNLLVDYALDNYINLYTMPTLKLVHSINIKDFNINDIINYVVLLSNPFPMICCASSNNIFLFDINGEEIFLHL
jgi:hypothetical protein